MKKIILLYFTIFYQHKDVTEIENVLKKECVRMVGDNKLLTHFGEDKTKYILFS